MSDLVRRLREVKTRSNKVPGLIREAATEIERLNAKIDVLHAEQRHLQEVRGQLANVAAMISGHDYDPVFRDIAEAIGVPVNEDDPDEAPHEPR